jgi:L-alanine-DL-glutamate epimerase-like enolase superfamily enzyme
MRPEPTRGSGPPRGRGSTIGKAFGANGSVGTSAEAAATIAEPVRSVRAAAYRIPLPEPRSDGTLTWDATTVVVVTVEAAGTRGIGYTYGAAACAPFVDELLGPRLLGTGASDVASAWRSMVDAVRNVGRPGVASMAIAAVDIALWDLKATLLGVSLGALLGAARTQVPVYGSGGFTSMSDPALVEQLRGWVGDAHITRVKMKIGTEWGSLEARDLDRVRIARQAIGDDVELLVDANGAYARKQAVRVGHALADQGVDWFEEPVSSDDLHGLREVRDLVGMDVAAGEYGYDPAYFERMCAAGAVDCLQADATRCAGITGWVAAADVAMGHGLQISSHTAQSIHVHAACSVPNLRHVEYFADHARAERILFDGVLEPREGVLRPVASRPGLGLELKEADAERFRVA